MDQVDEDASEPTQAVRQAALAAGWSHGIVTYTVGSLIGAHVT